MEGRIVPLAARSGDFPTVITHHSLVLPNKHTNEETKQKIRSALVWRIVARTFILHKESKTRTPGESKEDQKQNKGKMDVQYVLN